MRHLSKSYAKNNYYSLLIVPLCCPFAKCMVRTWLTAHNLLAICYSDGAISACAHIARWPAVSPSLMSATATA